ncbi:MAG: hypothetical protein KatS3mg076_2769 [Candidatus Binatia bacterium]|nr:MAG: hypothetical protein KatS3mg076_2769 [Candidatus Binatia bacterium]
MTGQDPLERRHHLGIGRGNQECRDGTVLGSQRHARFPGPSRGFLQGREQDFLFERDMPKKARAEFVEGPEFDSREFRRGLSQEIVEPGVVGGKESRDRTGFRHRRAESLGRGTAQRGELRRFFGFFGRSRRGGSGKSGTTRLPLAVRTRPSRVSA